MYYTLEAGNMMSSNFRRKVYLVNVSEQAVHFMRKGPSYVDVLSHINYKRYGRVPTRHRWCTNEMDGFLGSTGRRCYDVIIMMIGRASS